MIDENDWRSPWCRAQSTDNHTDTTQQHPHSPSTFASVVTAFLSVVACTHTRLVSGGARAEWGQNATTQSQQQTNAQLTCFLSAGACSTSLSGCLRFYARNTINQNTLPTNQPSTNHEQTTATLLSSSP